MSRTTLFCDNERCIWNGPIESEVGDRRCNKAIVWLDVNEDSGDLTCRDFELREDISNSVSHTPPAPAGARFARSRNEP